MFTASKIVKSVTILILTLFFSTYLSGAQDEDPFYINLINRGEQSFLNGEYEQAVKNLKIACFGIRTNTKLKGKAYVYLGLSFYYLKDKAQGDKYLKEAEKLLGPDGLNDLDINEEARSDLRRLSQAFKSGRAINPEGLRILPQVPAERVRQSANMTEDQLKQGMEQNPQNIQFYYELYSIFRIENNFKEAKKTIEKLIKKNPKEVFGYYLLGVILYREKEFKKATENFNKFFRLSANLDLRQEIRAEALAFRILTLYYRGERAQAAQLIVSSNETLSIGNISSLPLDDTDRIVLRSLLEEYER